MGPLLAYDAAGNIVGTLDHVVARDEHGDAIGLIDFDAHETAGGEHTDIWQVSTAVGSKVWPEWLGGRAHEFRVELAGPPGRKRIAALVHRESGHRRERAAVHQAIAAAPEIDGAKDLRHIVGGPQRPLHLDADGRNATVKLTGSPAHLPLIGRP
jgi:hypothetical protein